MSEQDLNAELARLIEHYGLLCLIEVGQRQAALDLADFCFKHRAALRIVPDAEPFTPPAWIAHVNSDTPKSDLDAG